MSAKDKLKQTGRNHALYLPIVNLQMTDNDYYLPSFFAAINYK